MALKRQSTKRKDGRLVKSISVDGKRIYFYGKTERELNRKILEFSEKQASSGNFDRIADDWWDEHEKTLSLQSIRGYKKSKDAAVSEFGKRPTADITPRDVIAYLKKVSSQGYSQKIVESRKMVLKQIFDYAINNNHIQYNPCTSVKIPKGLPKEERGTASQIDEKIIKSTFDLWHFPFIALYTGLRKGEILALQWKDIDFNEGFINVYKSVAHNGDKPVVKGTKTDKSTRQVVILSPLRQKLLELKEKINPDAEDYIVSDDGKSPLTNRRYITLLNRYKAKTGTTFTAHQLRHSFATIAIQSGIDPKTVQELLGHKQISTTLDLYTAIRKKTLLKAKNILESEFAD